MTKDKCDYCGRKAEYLQTLKVDPLNAENESEIIFIRLVCKECIDETE